MGLRVTFVSGARRSGKSAVIRTMVDRLWKVKPHYIRLVKSGSDKHPPKPAGHRPANIGLASAQWLEYDDDLVFEVLPEALAAIHHQDRGGSVVIEADADPVLRCAYPYDHRVFVMPVPSSVHDVFRDPGHAAHELQRALDDTVAFASEMFGLFTEDGRLDEDPSEERADLTGPQMRSFLYSPLGDELATRIQLQPAYHGLVESDVIVVNDYAGEIESHGRECLERIERLLDRLRGHCERTSQLFLCDPRDSNGKSCKKLLKALKPMCQRSK